MVSAPIARKHSVAASRGSTPAGGEETEEADADETARQYHVMVAAILLSSLLSPTFEIPGWEFPAEVSLSAPTLDITDSRTSKSYQLPIENSTVRALDLRPIKEDPEEFGMMAYDPGFTNTASCTSRITFIDGDKGILRYRGYPIEELAQNCSYIEVAYLLLHGELPTQSELEGWNEEIQHHMMVHENIKKFVDGFLYDAHPMGMLISTVAALSTFYPDAKNIRSKSNRRQQQLRLIGKMPTMAAYAYRHSLGLPYAYPDNDLSYTENFMNMLWRRTELKYKSSPVLAKALDVLFILHADHEQNCSTSTMRTVASADADPYISTAAQQGRSMGVTRRRQ